MHAILCVIPMHLLSLQKQLTFMAFFWLDKPYEKKKTKKQNKQKQQH